MLLVYVFMISEQLSCIQRTPQSVGDFMYSLLIFNIPFIWLLKQDMSKKIGSCFWVDIVIACQNKERIYNN